MVSKIKRYEINCLCNRTTEISNHVAENNKEFKELTRKMIPILNTIKDALPSEFKGLLDELEYSGSKREQLVYKSLYKQGFIDGIRIRNFHI